MPRRRLLFGALVLGLWPGTAWADFFIDGVIHNAQTLQPIVGVAVFLRDETTGALLSPGSLNPPNQQGQITGPNGRYSFQIVGPSVQVRIELERPDARFVFPSQTRPPEGEGVFGGTGCAPVGCPGGLVAFTPEPTETSRYLLRFTSSGGGSGRNNHVPVDDLSALIRAELQVDRQRARRGSLVRYTATFNSQARDPINDATIVLDLPAELRMRPGTLELLRVRQGLREPIIVTPRRSALSERWVAPELDAGDQLVLSFLAAVVRPSGAQPSRARTRLERPGGIAASNEAEALLTIEEDPLLDESTILGQVYCEGPEGRADWVDAEERGLYGARVYLDTGFYADTDIHGQFHFSGVPPGTRLLKLDEASLPPGSRPTVRTRAQLYLSPGTPAQVRFPVACALAPWGPPDQVELGTAVVAPPPPGPAPASARTLAFGFDPRDTSFRLGSGPQFLPRASLSAARDGDRVRFWPSYRGGAAPTRWRLHLDWISPAGLSVQALKDEGLTGPGRPPLLLEHALGSPPPGAVALRAQLKVEAGEQEWARSALLDLRTDPSSITSTVTRSLAPVTATTPEAARAGIAERVEALRAELGPGERLIVEGHFDAGEGEAAARAGAAALLEAAEQPLRAAGFSADALELRNRGAEVPRVPNSSPRLRTLNRRLELVVAPAPRTPPPLPRSVEPAGLILTVEGKEVVLSTAEPLALSMDLDVPTQVRLTLRDGQGGGAQLVRVVSAERVIRPGSPEEVVPEWDGQEVVMGSTRVPMPAPWRVERAQRSAQDGATRVALGLSGAADASDWRATWRDAQGRGLAVVGGPGGLPATVSLSSTSTSGLSPGGTIQVEVRQGQVYSVSAPIPVLADQQALPLPTEAETFAFEGRPVEGPIGLGGRLLERTGPVRYYLPIPERLETEPEAAPGPDLSQVAAADLTIESAQAGAVLAEPRLPLIGQTRPGNRVVINGVEVPTSEAGAFAYTAPLPLGKSQLRIESYDPEGHRAIFVRPVETSSSGWFLMGLAEAQVGTGGARLAGSNEQTHLDADPFGLDGRITAYGRARFVLEGPYRRISLVGRVDTAELGRPQVVRLTDDPLRLLPAFGDASLEIQETASRHFLFVELKADDSQLLIGNHTTTLGPDDPNAYLAFRRTGFGVHGDVRYRFGAHDQTRVRGLYADGNQGSLRGHDELLGTGGSMYWLSHQELVEGSARLELLVRDRDTGLILERRALKEGQDYELRPREGRLMLRTPLPGATGDGVLGINRSVANTGHPLYLVADYEYLAAGSDERAFGAEVRERLFDRVELAASYTGEDQGLSQHRLYGVALSFEPTERSWLRLEYAESSGQTSQGRLSLDGGLSYLDLSTRSAARVGNDPPFLGGYDARAYGLSAELDPADLGWTGPDRALFRFYGRRAGLGFSSLGSARESGRLEAGAFGRVRIGRAWTARASIDGAITARTEPRAAGALSRVLGVAGLDYLGEAQSGSLELAHLSTEGSNLAGATTGVAARYERQLLPALRLRVGQEALLQSDPATPSDLGVLATSVGASYDLDEHLSLEAGELLRWNGDNSSQLGLRIRTDEGLTGYVAERYAPSGRGRLTTIVGTEDHFGEASRTYGELQMDGGAHPGQVRAVLGMDHRFRIAEGLSLLLAYERAQLTDRVPVGEANSPYSALFGGVTPTLGGFGDTVRLLPGAVSRDALAVGATWSPWAVLSLQSQVELRVDDGDEQAGGRDFLTIGFHGGVALKAHRDVTFLGRLSLQNTEDQQSKSRYARFLEGSFRAAFRPHTEQWLTVLLGYTRQDLERPPLDGLSGGLPEVRDAFSVEPIIDTPFGVQLAERLALLRTGLTLPDGRIEATVNVLWINRLNARVYGPLEAAGEFRMLLDLDSETAEHGFLVEAGYVPDERVRIGLGYNFSRFSDNVLLLTTESNAGPFLRVTARY